MLLVEKHLLSFYLKIIINKDLDFAWHLDEVTKNLKPYILSKRNNELINLPDEQSCISKNFSDGCNTGECRIVVAMTDAVVSQ